MSQHKRHLLGEVNDLDFESAYHPQITEGMTVRKASRVVIVDNEGLVAVCHDGKNNFYQLPGGGIDAGETPEIGAIREGREEGGSVIDTVEPLGVILEYRTQHNKLYQKNFGFLGTVKEKKEPLRDAGEIASRYSLHWWNFEKFIMTLQEQRQTIQDNHMSSTIHTAILLITKRDLMFVQEGWKKNSSQESS